MGQPVSWALQAERLGTGHAVMQAMPNVPNDHVVLVLYGDVPLISRATLAELLALAGSQQTALLTFEVDDPTGYGRIVRGKRGRVQGIVEQKDASKKELKIRECNSGVIAAPSRLLKKWLKSLRNDNAQGEYLLTDVIGMSAREKVEVNPLVTPNVNEVLGVNDKVQLAELEGAFRRQVARDLMLAGVTVADPARLDVRGTVTHGADVFIDVNVVLEGNVKLGDRARIHPNCVIRDSEIGDDTQVFPNSVVENGVIGASCNIGPFARIRPGAKLAAGVHIGNFVEVKNSEIGPDSKANHLSYVGDTRVGGGVNVGAGTITCNYDGANKWPTEIGDGAFIGSGSMLVAPVRIGAGATIGAGSTIGANAPEGKLTLTRAPQVTSSSWTRPRKLAPEERAAAVDRALNEPQEGSDPAAGTGSPDAEKES